MSKGKIDDPDQITKCILFSSLNFVLNITSNIPTSKPSNFLWSEDKCRKSALQAYVGDIAGLGPDHRNKAGI